MTLASKPFHSDQLCGKEPPSNPLCHQLLIELYDCDHTFINSLESVKNALIDIARIMNFTVIDVIFHEYSPHGITGVVVIAESHIAVHTWPEYGYAAVDIFTCGGTVSSEFVQLELKRYFKAKDGSCQVIGRGLSKSRH